jgi:hypothetical protein
MHGQQNIKPVYSLFMIIVALHSTPIIFRFEPVSLNNLRFHRLRSDSVIDRPVRLN